MEEVTLLAHHVNEVRAVLDDEDSIRNKIDGALVRHGYSTTFYQNIKNWMRSLDPEDTYVTLLDEEVDGKQNFDNICALGCPYRKSCERGSEALTDDVFSKKGFVYGMIAFVVSKFSMHKKNVLFKKLGLETGRQYKLSELLA